MLQKEAVVPEMIDLIKDLLNDSLFKDDINEDNVRFLDINEIAAMKLNAITHRTEPRDFIDIAYLLKEISLKDMFELYKKKYDTISPLYMKRTLLIKSKSIKNSEWLASGIKMLRHDIVPKDVPALIEKAVEEYNSTINDGKK